MKRREFMAQIPALTALTALGNDIRANPIGISTYSFWRKFRGPDRIEQCIDLAAEMGFDGVELLQKQMPGPSPGPAFHFYESSVQPAMDLPFEPRSSQASCSRSTTPSSPARRYLRGS